MQYEFLKQFPKRMKHVGRYVLLFINSSQKMIWKQYGFLKLDEQINVIFSVMLYIMEQSLKEENCTIDDIGAYLDNLNMRYFKKNMSYEDCKNLGDFILNVILSNEGKAMYFDGYDFEQRAYQSMNISYVANRIVYVDSEVRRTSYYLTEDGYNLLLSTLEIENNMKLTIHEMVFKMHLEKQSYDKAVDEIKNIFNLLRIKEFAVHGGTAINLFHKNLPRYSVDIDLTYIPIQDRTTSLCTINERLLEVKRNVERTIPGIVVVPKPNVWKLLCTLEAYIAIRYS